MRIAFKEWAIIVDALGRGEQIIILRKGGLGDGHGGFRPEHPRFLLFPTLFHQQREAVLPAAQIRLEEIAPAFSDSSTLRLEFFADVVAVQRLDSLAAAGSLRGQHIWRDEVIARRFNWGKEENIHALMVRVFRLPRTIELPMSPGYGGCKSWVELEMDIATARAKPVLTDEAFARKAGQFHAALETVAARQR
jgi:hypothetical protein